MEGSMHKLKARRIVWALATVAIMMGSIHAGAAEKRVTVGNKNFTEQYLVGQLIKQLLEDRGFEVDLRSDLTSMALRAGMESGDIDICADYTGTAWMVHLKREFKPGIDHNQLYEEVKKEDSKNHFRWLGPMWNNNTYALASWPEFAEKCEVSNLSDLARLYQRSAKEIRTFVNFEFSTRPDGLPALETFYQFKVNKRTLRTGTPGASLIALRERQTDVAMVFGTDASIAKYGWHAYADDKSFFPPYDLTPYVREGVLKKYPRIAEILNGLVQTFPGGGKPATPAMVAKCQKVWQALNARVDIERMEPSEVAHDYLVQHGLVKP
jgi:osmoprotectant transport system substrate-binding protein